MDTGEGTVHLFISSEGKDLVMITYIKEDNSIQSYFGRLTDNDDAFYHWYHELSQYFTKHSKNVSAYLVSSIVNDVLCECKVSGMKFYGESKCHPEDKFSHDLGCYIAKNRLLDKYMRVRARIAKRIRKAVYKDVYMLGKIGKRDRKRDW